MLLVAPVSNNTVSDTSPTTTSNWTRLFTIEMGISAIGLGLEEVAVFSTAATWGAMNKNEKIHARRIIWTKVAIYIVYDYSASKAILHA